MSDTIWGLLFVLFGLGITAQGVMIYRDPTSASERMRASGAARFQPAWAVKRWTSSNMRARAISMCVGGPAFVVLGVLLLTGVIDLG